GVMVVPPKFRLLHIQPDGNIITNPQRFYGLLGKKGATLIPPEFDRIEPFEEQGLFRVERGAALGYMRVVQEQGEWAWPLSK
ncbi:WG repeat-containing protein, partial [Arthrospira platensis SPKY1]|nr:WG repeat-containing protein [Arthrospira platensis SPKY1]